MTSRTILITGEDLSRLERLIECARNFHPLNYKHINRLQEELGEAKIMAREEIPHDVVILNSEDRVRDLDAGREATYKIVFPRDAHVAQNRISVLAPIGSALLGYRAGDVVEWDMPSGRKRMKVQEVVPTRSCARSDLESA